MHSIINEKPPGFPVSDAKVPKVSVQFKVLSSELLIRGNWSIRELKGK